jgi:hypothetical protein
MDHKMEGCTFLGSQAWKLRPETPLYKIAHTVLLRSFGVEKHAPIFPGPQPVSIERRHIPLLSQEPYVVCEKTDGVRHALMCLKFQDRKYCLVVNRNLEFVVVGMRVPSSDVVLDGEMVQCHDGKWKFMVYDAASPDLVAKKAGLTQRLEAAKGVVKKIMKVKGDPFQVGIKTFWPMEQFQEFQLMSFVYETDGMVLTPEKDPLRVGTHETMFKWKPLRQNTIDFQVKRRPHSNKWGLYIQEKGMLYLESEWDECDRIPEQFLIEDGIMECMYVPDHKKWWPIKQRTDKNYPNARRTFWRTMINLREDIQPEEFQQR